MRGNRSWFPGLRSLNRVGITSSVSTAYTSIIGSLLGPALQYIGYGTSYALPSLIPSIEDIFRLHIAGLIGPSHLEFLLRLAGVDWSEDNNRIDQAWKRLLHLNYSYPSIAEAIDGRYSGILEDEEYRSLLGLQGFKPDAYDKLWEIHAEYPPPIQLLEMLNRGIIVESQFKDVMQKKGFYGTGSIDQYLRMRAYIPPHEDVIRFAVREVYNREQREALGLDAEWEENRDLWPWLKMSGMGERTYYDPETLTPIIRDVGRDYWAAHWQLPSPGQVFEMYHRLRPGAEGVANPVVLTKKERLALPDKGKNAISIEEYLKAADYAPMWRERLAAISRPPLGRIDLRRSWRARALGTGEAAEKKLIEKFLDLGYSQENAEIQARTVINEEERTLNKLATRSTFTMIRNMYREGLLSDAEVKDQFTRAGLPPDQVEKATSRILIEVKFDRLRNRLKWLKKRFMRYELIDDVFRTQLQRIIASPTRAAEIYADWLAEREASPKELTAKELAGFYVEDLISDTELLDRLHRIGYQPIDALLIKDNADIKKGKRVSKEIEQQEAAQLRALKRVSRTELSQWFLLGRINDAEFKTRLIAHGYLEEDAQRYLEELRQVKDALRKRNEPGGQAPQGQRNGQDTEPVPGVP